MVKYVIVPCQVSVYAFLSQPEKYLRNVVNSRVKVEMEQETRKVVIRVRTGIWVSKNSRGFMSV